MSVVRTKEFTVTERVAKIHTKTREQKRLGGRIDNWALYDWYGDKSTFVICGDVFEDENWPTGVDLRTSCVVKLDLENNEAETLNTIYKLGSKSEWAEQYLQEQEEGVL